MNPDEAFLDIPSFSSAVEGDYSNILAADHDPDLIDLDPVHSGEEPAPDKEEVIVVIGRKLTEGGDGGTSSGTSGKTYFKEGLTYQLPAAGEGVVERRRLPLTCKSSKSP